MLDAENGASYSVSTMKDWLGSHVCHFQFPGKLFDASTDTKVDAFSSHESFSRVAFQSLLEEGDERI